MTTTTIDVTPLWEEIVPALVLILENGTASGREIAIAEITRMAQLADKYVAIIRNEEKEND
jgi:hypothetical protein